MASQEEDILFVWAYKASTGCRVRAGWAGEKNKGVTLGDAIVDFESKYSGLTEISKNHLSGLSNGALLDAHFDKNGLLTELLVGTYINP